MCKLRVNKFCSVPPNICGSSARSTLQVIVTRILWWLLNFWKVRDCCCKWAITIGDRPIEFCLFADFTEANVGILNNMWFCTWSWILGTEIPSLHEEAPLHPSNCTVWYALSTAATVGLVLLQQNVTSECHTALVEENFIHCRIKSFYIKTEHDQALITASPPLPWLRHFYTLWCSIWSTVVLATTTIC